MRLALQDDLVAGALSQVEQFDSPTGKGATGKVDGKTIVLGSAGSMNGFMMQRGRQIICGDVGHGLGDSMYDGTIYVGGKVASLGIDCVEGLSR